MVSPDPEGELRTYQEKEKRRAVLMLFVKILVIDAVVITGYGILAKVFGWNETVLLILLVIIAVFTGCYYQWQKQKIERQG